jgi:hypothetical protein
MSLADRLRDFFSRRPVPSAAFQLSVSALAGLRLAGKESRAGRHVVLSLRPGSLEPSFDRPNLKDPGLLADRLAEALRRLELRDGNVSLLVSESCLKSGVLTFDQLPESQAERRSLILWRLKKQMPSLPESVRLSFDVLSDRPPWKVFASLIHPSVLAEYEGLFARQGVRVRSLGLPTLSLAGLPALGDNPSGLVANIEEDGLGLLVLLDSEVVFYRSKPFLPDTREAGTPARKMQNVAREITNTATFVEDREKRRLETLWVRVAASEGEEEALEALKPQVSLAVRAIEPKRPSGLRAREARYLAPLVAQLS